MGVFNDVARRLYFSLSCVEKLFHLELRCLAPVPLDPHLFFIFLLEAESSLSLLFTSSSAHSRFHLVVMTTIAWRTLVLEEWTGGPRWTLVDQDFLSLSS